MIYVYESEDGTVVERDFPMGEAPWQFEDETMGRLKRTFGASVIIPEYMRATSDSEIQHYDKKHWRGGKKYY